MDFIERRLLQLSPVGAKMTTTAWAVNEKVWVSTIRMAERVYTRVSNLDETVTYHFEGNLNLHDASVAYSEKKKEEAA